MLTLPSGKLLENYNTIELKMSLSSLVSIGKQNIHTCDIDEVKWAVRQPSRMAIREPKLTYLDKV
jgi:hypothetical protein